MAETEEGQSLPYPLIRDIKRPTFEELKAVFDHHNMLENRKLAARQEKKRLRQVKAREKEKARKIRESDAPLCDQLNHGAKKKKDLSVRLDSDGLPIIPAGKKYRVGTKKFDRQWTLKDLTRMFWPKKAKEAIHVAMLKHRYYFLEGYKNDVEEDGDVVFQKAVLEALRNYSGSYDNAFELFKEALQQARDEEE